MTARGRPRWMSISRSSWNSAFQPFTRRLIGAAHTAFSKLSSSVRAAPHTRGAEPLISWSRSWGRDGVAAWVLIHIEIQSQNQTDFAQRMFQYHYRLRDRFEHAVVSIAMLADDRPNWRPETYEMGLWGCEVRVRFT